MGKTLMGTIPTKMKCETLTLATTFTQKEFQLTNECVKQTILMTTNNKSNLSSE